MSSLLIVLLCGGGDPVMRWCWVNFPCWGVQLIWIEVGQGSTSIPLIAGGGCLDIFSLFYHFSFLSPSFWETARYRLKYCLSGPLSPKQPANQNLLCGLKQKRCKIDMLYDLILYTLHGFLMFAVIVFS